MRIDNQFTVPATPERAWEFLTDLGRVAPCLPGATVESVAGDTLTGRVALRIGPMNMSYAGEAAFVVKDDESMIATIEAGGRDGRGGGTVKATIKASLAEAPGGTQVCLATDLGLTGRVAQLGQGPIKELSAKLMGQFADCLAARLEEPATRPADAGRPGDTSPPAPPVEPVEPINLLDASPVSTKVLAGVAAVAVAVVVGILLGRVGRRSGGR
ncbi:SRPBCC domain-containing protein [Nocardioides soli]|uniref:Carbon monoxide dehydrogenase subunit G n=1 Tax=Nocardioides soli TaxID=1036020 RepID=A0A7W4YYZ2_9ACTN|nr:carbon monoxide dehydrogenase subunit G [Nocardioides soli]